MRVKIAVDLGQNLVEQQPRVDLHRELVELQQLLIMQLQAGSQLLQSFSQLPHLIRRGYRHLDVIIPLGQLVGYVDQFFNAIVQ